MITNADAFFIAAGAGMGLADVANKNAAKAAWDNRVNAFLAQGMTYDQAQACALDTYRQEAARLGPRGASGWAVFWLLLGLAFFAAISFPVFNYWSFIFMGLAVCCALGLRHQYRLYKTRSLWRYQQQRPRSKPVQVWVTPKPRKAIGSA